MPAPTELLVSGYTQDDAGPGIVRFAVRPDGLLGEPLAHSTAVINPSFLADAPDTLFAVEEGTAGGVVTLDPHTLELRGRASSGGADPCHLSVLDGAVVVANYSSGTAAWLAVADDGALRPPLLFSHPGTGPDPARQAGSHAHQVTLTPWQTVLVCDLGTDRVDEYALTTPTPTRLGSAQLPPGSGPRHLVLRGELLLVVGELDGLLHVFERSAGTWHYLHGTALAEQPPAGDFFPAHLQLSEDAALLFVTVRGPNSVVSLDVRELAAQRPPRRLGEVATGGNWPRHFTLGPGHLYIANQLSGTVTVLARDAAGLPAGAPVQTLAFGAAACVLLR